MHEQAKQYMERVISCKGKWQLKIGIYKWQQTGGGSRWKTEINQSETKKVEGQSRQADYLNLK